VPVSIVVDDPPRSPASRLLQSNFDRPHATYRLLADAERHGLHSTRSVGTIITLVPYTKICSGRKHLINPAIVLAARSPERIIKSRTES
jgi:hypothetical protein